MTTQRFVVLRTDYPMDVHAVGCADLSKAKYRRQPQDWIITGEDITDAVKKEAAVMSREFDREYEPDELFKPFPCCNQKAFYTLFCAVGPNCWGVGKTQDEAVKQAKRNWPRIKQRSLAKNFTIYATDAPEFFVSDFDGSVSVKSPHVLDKLQTSALATK